MGQKAGRVVRMPAYNGYNYRNRLERKLDEYNHIMELIRTVIPVIVLGLQILILIKLVN